MQNQMLYMSVSTHRMAAINHLGRIEHIYNLGNYIVHHDYQFDQDGNLILLATNEEKNSVEDCIIKLDVRLSVRELDCNVRYCKALCFFLENSCKERYNNNAVKLVTALSFVIFNCSFHLCS